jgi:hypothetical protein
LAGLAVKILRLVALGLTSWVIVGRIPRGDAAAYLA